MRRPPSGSARTAAPTARTAAPTARTAAALFVVVAVVHLGEQLRDADGVVASVSQVLLVPPLAVALATGVTQRTRMVRLVLLALFFSWLGDTVPRFLHGDAGFLAMVGAFLFAQCAYIAAFQPLRDDAAPWTRWAPRTPYVVAFLVLVVWCGRSAGAMLAPMVVYGIVLTLMAILSTGVSRVAGVGGALFMLSDALIALRAFADVDIAGFWVMLTYVAGQALICAGVAARVGRRAWG